MRRESRRGWSTVGVTGIVITATILGPAAQRAEAYCRTTTSKVPPDYDPAECGCWTYGLPLYWSNACVSYDIQQDASSEVPYAAAASAIATAFSKWTSTTCSADAGTGRVSIDVRDFGPVACGKVEYDQYGPNQHVILFDKNLSDFTDSSNALALTTVTYNIDTGEIFDADMQINATVPLSTSATPPTGSSSVYDFASIVTHETGHFLGMAHAVDARATMYAFIDPGEDSERLLTLDDRNGICTIYPRMEPVLSRRWMVAPRTLARRQPRAPSQRRRPGTHPIHSRRTLRPHPTTRVHNPVRRGGWRRNGWRLFNCFGQRSPGDR